MSVLGRCLRLYAPAIVLIVEAALVQLVPNAAGWIVMRLLVLAVALAVSIREQRRGARREQRKR